MSFNLFVFIGLFFSFCVIGNSIANEQDDILNNYLKQRQKMIERINKFFDEGSDEDFFEFQQGYGFPGAGRSTFKVEKKEISPKSYQIIVSPDSKEVELNFETDTEGILIKATKRVEEKIEDKNGVSQSISTSSSQQYIGIEPNSTVEGPKVVDDKIVFTIKLNNKEDLNKAPNSKGRTPVKKSKSEMTL